MTKSVLQERTRITDRQIHRFRSVVYAFFREHARILPWRSRVTPYGVLVSEVMLQQTQVPRVVQKYPAFMRAFPTIRACAGAPVRDVLAAWQGLGYNRRAVMLHRAVKQIVTEHRGRVPRDVQALDRLPGIGAATAASIAAFGFNAPTVFIETNIRSVFIHHFFTDAAGVTDEELLPLVERALDRANPRSWYSALMDYGTFLKEQLPNPGRRSAHYVRQSRFEGSMRQLRGAVIRALLAEGRMDTEGLTERLGVAEGRLTAVLAQLGEEGLIRSEKGHFFL